MEQPKIAAPQLVTLNENSLSEARRELKDIFFL